MTLQAISEASYIPTSKVIRDTKREDVQNFVSQFYDAARIDDLIGPIFERIIQSDHWPDHIDMVTDFWMAVAFDGPPFRGNPMIKHARIRDIDAVHFERWLQVFSNTASQFWPKEIAQLLVFRAQQIVPALLRGVDRAREKSLVTEEDLH